MTQTPGAVYRIQEFARLAGVTVRALHHYDRLGLMKPSGRSEAGYRLYRDCDLARAEGDVDAGIAGARQPRVDHATC